MASLFRAPTLRDRVRASAENRPGVYWMRDRQGGVIYVGRSIRVRTRLLSYFRGPADSKPRRIIREAASIDWTYAAGDLGARLEELRAIRRLRPRHNRQLKGTAGYCFLRVGPPGVPRLQIVRRIRPDGSRYYGPFRGKAWLEETARILSDWAGLRTCADSTPMCLSDQGLLFGSPRTPLCPRFELKRCHGPCAERCDESAYARWVRRVEDFLSGADDAAPVEHLRTGMEAASAGLQFEYAARLRDQIDRLLDFRSLRDAEVQRRRDLSGAFSIPLVSGGRRWWYFLSRGCVLAEMEAGPDVPGDFVRLAHRAAGPDEADPAAASPFAAQEAGLVAAWFEAHPEERERIIPPADILRRME